MEKLANHQLINQDSGNTEWWTPKPIVQVAKRLMGWIDLDPACSVEAWNYQGQHSGIHYADNGLEREWFGKVWMNHPFGRQHNMNWINRVVSTISDKEIEQACCITFASVSERWFQPLLQYPMFFFCGRINYIDPVSEKPVKGVTKGSVFTYLYNPELYCYEEARQALRNVMASAGFEGVAK